MNERPGESLSLSKIYLPESKRMSEDERTHGICEKEERVTGL